MSTPKDNSGNIKFEEQDKFYVQEQDETPLGLEPSDRRLLTQPFDFIVRSLVDQINDESLDAHPSFQRGYVWDDSRASRLIESLLMNIPIPVCYFAEETNGKFTVIDGHQRLHSIWRYVSNHFKLRGLKALTEFNGLLFKEIGEREKRVILGRSIRCIVITQDSHPEIRFEVFHRLNTGTVPATDQEIRNAIYHGQFNDLLKDLAKSDHWLQTKGSARLDKRMRDEELILRFFAVNENYAAYQAPLRKFLNNFSERKTFESVDDKRVRKSYTDSELIAYTNLFIDTMEKVRVVYNDHAFRGYKDNKWERQVNRALFDAVTLVFSNLDMASLVDKKDAVEQVTIELLTTNLEFKRGISGSTSHRNSFYERIRLFSEAMKDIGLDSKVHNNLPDHFE